MVSRPYRGHYPPAAYAAAFRIIILLQFILLSLVSIVRSEGEPGLALDGQTDGRGGVWRSARKKPGSGYKTPLGSMSDMAVS